MGSDWGMVDTGDESSFPLDDGAKPRRGVRWKTRAKHLPWSDCPHLSSGAAEEAALRHPRYALLTRPAHLC